MADGKCKEICLMKLDLAREEKDGGADGGGFASQMKLPGVNLVPLLRNCENTHSGGGCPGNPCYYM